MHSITTELEARRTIQSLGLTQKLYQYEWYWWHWVYIKCVYAPTLL